MQFLNGTVPDIILNNVVALLQPFCEEPLVVEDIRRALLQYQRPLLTVREFAAQASCSKRTVYRAIQDGRIKAIQVGLCSYRIPITQLSAWCGKSEGA